MNNEFKENIERISEKFLGDLKQDNYLLRILNKDKALWHDLEDSRYIEKGLEWIDTASQIIREADRIKNIALQLQQIDFKEIVLIGMGGSSIVKEIFIDTYSNNLHPIKLFIVNSILPSEIAKIAQSINHKDTLFIIISGSGETIETRMLFEYFWNLTQSHIGTNCLKNFVVITTHNSPLSSQALEKGIDQIVYFSGNLWGRYRVLGMPGLLPAVLAGIDITNFTVSVDSAVNDLIIKDEFDDNPALKLGVNLAALYRAGKRNLIIFSPPELSGLAEWISELVAESTAKDGKGFIAILGEAIDNYPIREEDIYLFLETNDSIQPKNVQSINDNQIIMINNITLFQVGYEIIKWGLAILTFCYLNKLNPFIEPQFIELSAQFKSNHKLQQSNNLDLHSLSLEDDLVKKILFSIAKIDYVVLQIFFGLNKVQEKLIKEIQKTIQHNYSVPCVVCFGTKFIHSIGQQYKGGNNNGVFFQLVEESNIHSSMPQYYPYQFDNLLNTLVNSDFEILETHNRRIVQINFGQNASKGLRNFQKLLQTYLIDNENIT